MNRRRPIYCYGLLALLGAAAGHAAEPDGPLPIEMNWGRLHLRNEVPYELPSRRPVPPVASPIRERILLNPALLNPEAFAPRQSQPHKRRTFQLELDELYFQTEVQYERENQQAGTPATTATMEQALVDPVLGVGVSGALYHPNLVQFQLGTELGLDWRISSQDPGGGSENSGRFLQRYHGTINLLSQKPYAVSLFADKDMTYREYDFFSRVRVDNESYGARAGYTTGPFPFTVSAQHYDEYQYDPVRPQSFVQDTFSATTENQRKLYDGHTRLDYNATQFSRRDDGLSNQQGTTHSLSLYDTENFGGRTRPQLISLLNYNTVVQTAQPTEKLLAQETLRLQHTPKLESFYEYAFNNVSAGNAEASTHEGQASVSYQQTQHLTLGGNLLGSFTQSSSPGSSLDTKSYGVGANAQYARPLASWLAFSCGDSGSWNHEDRSASGTVQDIPAEPVTLNGSTWVDLKQPLVIAIIEVYNATNPAIIYRFPDDYETRQIGAITQIRRNPGLTTIIPDPGQVVVHYSATLQGSTAYDSLANNASFRVDLWQGLLGIYGQWAVQVFNGGEQLLLRQIDDKTIGLDSTWRWFRAGAEYQVVDSNEAPYERRRLFQSAQFQPLTGADLSLNADQNWTDYTENNLHQTSYGFITRWQQRVTAQLSAIVEGGVRFEHDITYDRDYATCRAGLDWAVGKLTVKLNYEFNGESQLSNLRDRHYIFIRVRRDFR